MRSSVARLAFAAGVCALTALLLMRAHGRRAEAELLIEIVSGMMAMRGEDYSTLQTIKENLKFAFQ